MKLLGNIESGWPEARQDRRFRELSSFADE